MVAVVKAAPPTIAWILFAILLLTLPAWLVLLLLDFFFYLTCISQLPGDQISTEILYAFLLRFV